MRLSLDFHVFSILLGRGLNGCPLGSSALFHGARTSDVTAAATVLRKSLPTDVKLFLCGISLGGIIAANAACKGDLDGIVDGVVSICGCFDTLQNSTYHHSLTAWQPVLNHPLKGAFVDPPGNVRKMLKRVGVNTTEVVSNLVTITDFDYSFITPLHRFKDALHYYRDMSATDEKLVNLKIPLLALHAADDPILHVDTHPVRQAVEGKLTQNLICLITRTGGHVGWSLGWFPWLSRWLFQNTITFEFFESIANCDHSKHGLRSHGSDTSSETGSETSSENGSATGSTGAL